MEFVITCIDCVPASANLAFTVELAMAALARAIYRPA